jgi:hypothetical protein
MSISTPDRRPQVQRLALAGLGAAVLLVAIASPATAATGVVIPLEPTEAELVAFPVENFGGSLDPMADPNATPAAAPVGVRYTGTIAVDLPAELDDSAVGAKLLFDDNGDGTPDVTYSTAPAGSELPLTITGQGSGTITVTLPADDNVGVDAATLLLEPLASTLSPAFTYYDPVFYELAFDAAAPVAQSVMPELIAFSQVPCAITSTTPCPFPTPVTAGSTVVLDLTAGSVLRELGLVDLTGVELGFVALDGNGQPLGAAATLRAQVTGSTASFVVPVGTAAGSYGLVVAQQTPSGGISVVVVQLTVEAEAVVVVPPAAAPTTPAPQPVVLNAGLRSNTGVEVVETGSAGTVAVAAGTGLLLVAGAGGVAVARTRRRPAVEGGTCSD